ncbi:MAG: MFS transporter [Alphaproteobacteria bacterium]
MTERKLSKELIFFIVVTINTIIINMDSDIYVPSFPSILKFFSTTPEKVQLILSANFLGLCISSLFYGPLADCYGRRKTLIGGFSIFLFGVTMCSISSSIESIIFWRFIQGIGSAAPIIVGGAAIFDVYKKDKAIQLIAIWNSVGTASMATAPLMGGLLNTHFGWKSNFIFILVLSVVSFTSIIFFFRECLPKEYRKCLSLKQTIIDYKNIGTHKKYLANSLICALMYGAIMVYISNLSLIFIDFLSVAEDAFSYYQAFTMSSYVIFSIACAKLIPVYGLKKIRTIGVFTSCIGAVFMLFVALFKPLSPSLISLSMAVIIAGVAFAIGIFGARSMEFFPDLKGMASALGTSFRLLITSVIIIASSSIFNGSILPIGIIIFVLISICLMLHLWLVRTN